MKVFAEVARVSRDRFRRVVPTQFRKCRNVRDRRYAGHVCRQAACVSNEVKLAEVADRAFSKLTWRKGLRSCAVPTERQRAGHDIVRPLENGCIAARKEFPRVKTAELHGNRIALCQG